MKGRIYGFFDKSTESYEQWYMYESAVAVKTFVLAIKSHQTAKRRKEGIHFE